MVRICTGFNADLDPAFYRNAGQDPDTDPGVPPMWIHADPDPDPGQTLPSQKDRF